MKTFHFLVLVALLSANVFAAKIALNPTPVTTRIKWEYRVESVPDENFSQAMDNIGAEGWEMVSARRATTGSLTEDSTKALYEVIFKRPRV